MLNSISELYNLKLEKVNPTLTLDWLITRFYKLSLLCLFSSLGFSLLSQKLVLLEKLSDS